ncbi:Dps family protein [Flavobacterium commune]|uniref:DNA starvation/stationary phase protection protein n=1 Tax=Flavobacterium commune TaxID=1306519 RepID=A0A1D9PBE1_9FLAO|nr:DNA starvation/stationary phase protection protein [Flavobacterium commune]AOZ99842.1 DNA starvation/stationary phase protection protein [Flavobacterium commune]
MEPKIGITKKELESSINCLTTVLANEMLLYTKTRKFHWNVSGNSFMELHKLFESQYTALEQEIDEIAERISKLGGNAIGTMKEFIDNSILKENLKTVDQREMLHELLTDHETVLKQLRDFVKTVEETQDYGTTDFLTALIQKHEEQSWMLRKYIDQK